MNLALLYMYMKATGEVKHFCEERICVEVDEVLLGKGTLLSSMNFRETGELQNLSVGQLGVGTHLPVIERFNQVAYSIMDHVNWKVAKHCGAETCVMSLEIMSILQVYGLSQEIYMDLY